MQNPANFTENLNNLGNLEEFYKNMGGFGGQIGNFSQRMSEFGKKMGKK